MATQKFDLGRTLATPGVLSAFERNKTNGLEYLVRHALGDWGDLCEEDKQANEAALIHGTRILSAYLLPDETKIWIITEGADARGMREATTFLLPEEY